MANPAYDGIADGNCRHLANWDEIGAAVEQDAICLKAGENRDIFLGEFEVLQTRVADAEGTPPAKDLIQRHSKLVQTITLLGHSGE